MYLAWDEEIERHVAIKLPRRGLFTAARQVDDFLREARMVAGAAPGDRLGVRRRPAGRRTSVRRHGVRRRPDPGRRPAVGMAAAVVLVGILAVVADAVLATHSRGLVHRDLKPANILIDRDGAPRVTDFGLAVHEDFQRLRHGEIAGTPAYMSPEQVRGETHRLDGRTDVWGLGVILYQILSKHRPFNGSDGDLRRHPAPRPEAPPADRPDDPRGARADLPEVPDEADDRPLRLRDRPRRRPPRLARSVDLGDDLAPDRGTNGSRHGSSRRV